MQPTTANAFNLVDLYKEYFGKNPYHINSAGNMEPAQEILYSGLTRNPRPKGTIHMSRLNAQSFNKIGAYGQDIWHPVTITGHDETLERVTVEVDICTTSVQLLKNIIRTPVTEQKGSVIEICDIENPRFTIRGFLTTKDRTVPEVDIMNLQKLFNTNESVFLHGGYVELFLPKTYKVVISDLEFPELQGKAHWIRAFTLQCEADFIETLEVPEGE